MLLLPPLEGLRFFEAAARHQSFARAADELEVTPAAVAHRVRMLEKHLEVKLFERRQRGVRVNRRGQAYLKEVQRILAEIHGVSERQRRWPRRVRIVLVEAVAEKWLLLFDHDPDVVAGTMTRREGRYIVTPVQWED